MSNEMVAGLAIAALLVGAIALVLGLGAFVLALAMKMSTHQVTWKTVGDESSEDPFQEELPMFSEPELGENPNKRMKREEEEDFADLDDPSISSNNW